MEVGEDDGFDVRQREPRFFERAGKLPLRRDVEPSERDVAGVGRLAGVDEHEPVAMLDRPAVNRDRVAPGAGEEEIQLPSRAGLRVEEGVLEARRARGQSVYPHQSPAET